jgi:hypothetical protein
MPDTFQTHVYVSDPETGQNQWFAPGDKAPPWTDGLVSEEHFKEPEVDEDGNPIPEAKPVDYSKLLKEDLIALADDRGLDSTGNKDDIIERLVENDNALR